MRAVGLQITSSIVAATAHTPFSLLFLLSTIHRSWLSAGLSVYLEKTSISTLLHVRHPKSFFSPLQQPGSLYRIINNIVMGVKGAPERTVGHVVQRVLAVFMVVCLAKLPSDIYQQVYQINIAYTPSPQSNAAVLIGPLGCDNQTQDWDKCLEGYLWEKAMIWICAMFFFSRLYCHFISAGAVLSYL